MSLSIITTTVAIIVAIITFGQWVNGRNSLKLSLFEKRYAQYEVIAGYLANTLQSGRIEKGADIKFLQDTKKAYYLFACDPSVKKLISDIYTMSIDLYALQQEEHAISDNAQHRRNIERQSEIHTWLNATLDNMEGTFEQYLKLEH